jgi:hypothetical protein
MLSALWLIESLMTPLAMSLKKAVRKSVISGKPTEGHLERERYR